MMIAGAQGRAEENLPEFRLGVQAHFEQGWSTQLIERAAELGAVSVRDEISWRESETTKGIYDFSIADQYMQPLIEAGIKPFIVFTGRNPLYDEGQTPYSDEGIAGVANFISAIYSHYGAENIAIEIGNEVNSDDFVTGPFAEDKPGNLAAVVRAVDEKLARDNPGAEIVCAGLNTIAMEFYRDFFRAGGLLACDGISFHPYRDYPYTLRVEIDRLKQLMQLFGGEKPLYATEFGIWLEDPEEAPDYMSKMVIELASAGVREAHWYALTDEPWWPNMGLLEEDGKTEKPAADAFRFLQENLLPLGRPVSRSDLPSVRVFEFGSDGKAYAVWGAGGRLKVDEAAEFYDTRGRRIDRVDVLSDTPVYVIGEGIDVTVESAGLVADSLYQFNQPPWSYLVLRAGRSLRPLEIIDWNWTSYRGSPELAPLAVRDTGITTARFHDKPYHAIERFTANEAGAYLVGGWWRTSEDSEPSRLIIRHNRNILLEVPELQADPYELDQFELVLEAGDVVDFELAPAGPSGDSSVRRRIQVFQLPAEE
ncbi:hypothetical protein [Roseovarius sp. MMSF_3350]|uniref:hypothetical protein n=2 Tax=unclassified Roseovarius TaxID=2614913 RepID=UPI00273E81DC|nr:hypothetical protein [Roseovarius sp. MMSF_3350]